MKIIDAHIHPFIYPANNIAVYGAPVSLEEFIGELKRANIVMACGSVIMKTEALALPISSDLMMRHWKFSGAIQISIFRASISTAVSPPNRAANWNGYIGSANLFPNMMKNGPYDAPGMMDIYAVAQDLAMPVNVHVWPSPLNELETFKLFSRNKNK